MFVEHLLRGLGNQTAIDNARAASTALSQRRVEREEVEIFLARLHGPTDRPVDPGRQLPASGQRAAGERGRLETDVVDAALRTQAH